MEKSTDCRVASRFFARTLPMIRPIDRYLVLLSPPPYKVDMKVLFGYQNTQDQFPTPFFFSFFHLVRRLEHGCYSRFETWLFVGNGVSVNVLAYCVTVTFISRK